MPSKLENKLELKVNKGKLGFIYKDDKGEEQYYQQFGYLKGESKWAKILEADQYGNYAVDVYPNEEDLTHLKEIAEELAEEAKTLVEGAGKKVSLVADLVREDDESGKEYFQFKRKELKGDGSPNTPPKIYDASGTHVPDWDKLVGNGSTVKVGYILSPYYMAATKTVGVSYKFYAIQVIKLEQYEGGTGNSGFGDETDGDAPFDSSEEF